MRRLLSSRRRRRRLLWLTIVAALAAGATVTGLFYSNTGDNPDASAPGGPVKITVPRNQKTVPVATHFKEIEAVVAKFVSTAVMRRHVDQSYDLVASQLKQGMTRAQWQTGNIPVVPYERPQDLSFTKIKVTYSYTNRVGLIVGMFPKAKAKTKYEAFSMELVAYRRGPSYRWLIDAWAPAGFGIGDPNGPPVSPAAAGHPSKPPDRVWILLPIVFLLSMIVLIPGSLFVRGWLRERNARRRIVEL
ncbi:MAG TPA: hypothetical protein VLJ76_01530 [Gaiellaceae bacterium]|nr:hypothetical protein [Gaiellaceae bacterium]